MISSLKVSNDLSMPLQEHDVEWNLYIYKKRYKTKDKIKSLESYDMYKIDTLRVDTLYSDIYNYISKNYVNKLEIDNYAAEMPKNRIGYISLHGDNILKNGLNLLNECLDNYVQFASRDLSLHGYVLECKINGQTYMKVLSSSNPIKFYKHKYSLILGNNFNELTGPVLSLNINCDCIVLNDYALFFTGKAESIFDLEKHYKALANKYLSYLKTNNLIEDFDTFFAYASSWPKAAKFESFDVDRMQSFSKLDINHRRKILCNYAISINEKGAIIANSPEEKEQALNFTCGKLFTDFNDDSYEVPYSKKINRVE